MYSKYIYNMVLFPLGLLPYPELGDVLFVAEKQLRIPVDALRYPYTCVCVCGVCEWV